MEVERRLLALEEQAYQAPDVALALARFRARVQLSQPSLWTSLERRLEMAKRTLQAGRWRPVAVGVMTLALLVGLFSLAPVRQAAAQFLGIFRVRKFAVIPVDPARVNQLEGLANLLESGMLGQPTFLRQPGAPQAAADAAAASKLAGFTVRAPSDVPQGATAGPFTVEVGPAVRLEVDRDMAQAALEAAGVQGVTLPPFKKATAEVDVPVVVQQEYRTPITFLSVVQAPSPTVTLPPGLDPAQLGEVLLQVLGMPASDAHRLAQTIDWTCTLIVPAPTNVVRFREVEVDGVTGLFLEESRASSRGPAGMVTWQKNGILYAVIGENIALDALTRMADSLR